MTTSNDEKASIVSHKKRVLRSVAEKKAIVAQLEAGVRQNELVRELGVAASTLLAWTKKYGSPSFLANKHKRRVLKDVFPIVRAIREGRLTIKEAATQNKTHFTTIRSWIKKCDSRDANMLPENPQPTVPVGQTDSERELHQALEAARLKIRALETIIEVAENDLKIPIRKKPGAKQ